MKSQAITKVIMIHPLGNMNVWATFCANPSNNCMDEYLSSHAVEGSLSHSGNVLLLLEFYVLCHLLANISLSEKPEKTHEFCRSMNYNVVKKMSRSSENNPFNPLWFTLPIPESVCQRWQLWRSWTLIFKSQQFNQTQSPKFMWKWKICQLVS